MIIRKTNKENKDNTENTSKPFIDVSLEFRVLRLLIFDNEFDSKTDVEEVNSNISYLTFLGLPKEAFTSELKQWVYERITLNYLSYSECISKSYLYDELKTKYPHADVYSSKKVVLDKIFGLRFEAKSFKPFVEKLKEKYQYRTLFDLNLRINEQLRHDFVDNKHESLVLAQDIQDSVNKLIISSGKFRVIEEDIFHDIKRDIDILKDKKENPYKYRGIPSGYKKIDLATGGWQPGEFIVVLGRPGMGKSILLLNFGYNAYKLKYNVVYVTIEMPIGQQRDRFTSLITKVTYNKIKQPRLLSDEEITEIEKKLNKTKSEHKNFYWLIDAPAQCTAQFIDSRIIAFENVTGQKVDLLIVDPLYLMKPSEKTDDPVGTISWDLKLLARSRNFPILGASQFNRESHKRHTHGKEADTMDAAFSDKLGHNSDVMMGITGDKETACLSFPKSRDSQISKLFFIKKFDVMRFEYDSRVDDAVEKDEE